MDEDTTEIQLRVELRRLDRYAYATTMTKNNLQLAIIKLRLRKQENLAAAEAHPNASCITHARPNQDLHQRDQVAPTVDEELKRALLTLTQLQHENAQVQHENAQAQHENAQAQHENAQAQFKASQVQQEANALFRREIVDLQRNQNAQGATIVQHDQRITATEEEMATTKKEMATMKKELAFINSLLQQVVCTA